MVVDAPPGAGRAVTKLLRLLSAALLVVGLALTTRTLYLEAKAELAGVLLRRAWTETIRTGQPQRPWPWADMRPVARLRIPRLKYDEIVLDSATPRALAFGPAHLLNSADFSEPGNIVLAGHRTSWFRPLEHVATGDRIDLEWVDGTGALRRRTYTVSTIRVSDPEDLTLLAPTSDDQLTLLTCYPFSARPDSPLRYLVRATPVP